MAVNRASRAPASQRTRARPLSSGERLSRFLRTPKGTMLWVLGGLAVLGAATTAGHPVGLLAWAVAAAALTDLAITQLRQGRWVFPSGAILTGLFVGMVLAPLVPHYAAVLVAALAILGKHLLRTRWSNIFNPAALALVVTTLFLPSSQSWWGALPRLGVFGFVLLLAAGWYIAAKINKLRLALAFLATSSLIFTVAAFTGAAPHVEQFFRSPDTQMLLFFACFMLSDPPTSPARPRDQIWFGIVAAVVGAAIFLRFGVQWFLLGGLLAANAIESVRRVVAARGREAQRRAAGSGRPRRAAGPAGRTPGRAAAARPLDEAPGRIARAGETRAAATRHW